MKKILSLMMLLVAIVTEASATDYAITCTRTYSTDLKTSTWSAIKANNGSTIQGTNDTATGDGIYVESKNAKVTLNAANSNNYKSNAIVYLAVPSSSSTGTITCDNGNNSDRYFETESGGKVYNSGTNKTINFTSADVVSINNGTYLKLTSKSDCKLGGLTVTLTSDETYASVTKLTAPTINDDGDGNVTISGDTNASSVKYTTDGTDPSATNGETYSASFAVADGTTVKAVCIGDGTTYSNSDITTEVIYVAGVTVATPTINAISGTVALACATAGASIQYSTNGTDYSAYTIPFTLTSAATVYAKATRTGATDSEVASQEVAAAPAATAGSSSITLYYNTTDMTLGDTTPKGLTGNTGTDYEGWSMIISGNDKNIQYGNEINGNTALKGSNGRAFNITMPEGVKANRITIYSYNNGDFSGTSLWSEVAGTTYTSATEIGLESTSASTPDVRVFALADVEGTFSINNNGVQQQCFTAVVDYTAPVVPSISAENVNISEDATNDGEIEFTVNNPVEGGSVSATKNEEATWLTLGEVDNTNGKVPFTATANTESAGRTATVTLTYTYNTNETVTKEVTIAQAADVTGTAIIKATLTAKNAATVTGTIGGTANVNLQSTQDETGGYKFGGKGNYFGVTLENGTFQAGDVINVHTTTTAQQGTIAIYDSSAGTNLLYDTGVYMTSGTAGALENTDNKFALPAAVNGESTIYVCRTEANNWNGYVDYIEVTRPNATITLNANGYATYSNAEDFEFAGAQAYKMALTTTSLQGTEVTGKIPAGEGILFKGTPNATVSIINTTGAEEISDNDLMGTTPATGDAPAPDYTNHKYFVLKGNTFKPYSGANFTANKACFKVDKDFAAQSLDITFDDAPTAVEAVAEAKVNVNVPVKVIKNGQLFIGNYNVAGQRVK